MAQKRYWNFLDDDETAQMNQRELVIIPPGRYSGFDGVLGAGLTLTLNHETSGKIVTLPDGTNSPKLGVWRSKQGVIIREDEPINLLIDENPGELLRIDLIVGEHEYVASEGGATALYKVIKGTPSASTNPPVPALPSPNTQVILGVLYIPEDMDSLDDADVVYIPSRRPDWMDNHILADHVDSNILNPVQNEIIRRGSSGKWENILFQTFIQITEINSTSVIRGSSLNTQQPGSWPTVYHTHESELFAYFNLQRNHYTLGNNTLVTPIVGAVQGIVAPPREGQYHSITCRLANWISFRLNSPDLHLPNSKVIKLWGAAPGQEILQMAVDQTIFFTYAQDTWWIFDPLTMLARIAEKAAKGGIANISGFPNISLAGSGFEINGGGSQFPVYKDEFNLVHFPTGALKYTEAMNSEWGQIIVTLPVGLRPKSSIPFRNNLVFACPVINTEDPYLSGAKIVLVEVNQDGTVRLKEQSPVLVQHDIIDVRNIRFFA